MKTFDVIVLGVGGMGSATCYHLARRGVRVLGLEQFDLGHPRGSSHGETRLIRQAYFEHPDYVPLLRRAYALWFELNEAEKYPIFNPIGLMMYGPSFTSEILQGVLDSATLHGIPVNRLEADQAATAYPGYQPPEGYVGVFEPQAGYLKVEAGVLAHIRLARETGAEIHSEEPVLGWAFNAGGVTVKTGVDTYHADRLVVTAGAWSHRILKELRLGLTVHRNKLHWFSADATYEVSRGMPCFAFDLPYGFFYGFPVLDHSGLKIAHHTPGPELGSPALLNEPDEAHDAEDLFRIQQCLQSVLPGVEATAPLKTVNCLYTMSRDSHFILDIHPEHPELVFAGGFSGHGFKFSPVIGEIMADLALSGETAHPIGFLRLR